MKTKRDGDCNTCMKAVYPLVCVHGASFRLCPVFFNGKLILRGGGLEDAARQVDIVPLA
ncbi:MAG: hypothetical protein LAO06_01710 [Acidobacteriia bacterium]|nr:hypothetical protein [Terriglobia bacterium]